MNNNSSPTDPYTKSRLATDKKSIATDKKSIASDKKSIASDKNSAATAWGNCLAGSLGWGK